VAGFSEESRHRAVRRWLADRPQHERWAVLVDGVLDDRGPAPGLALDSREGVDVFGTAAGCACCVGALALRSTLARVLRQGPWHRLLLVLSAPARPAALIDALRAGIVGDALRVDAVIAVVDARRPGPWLDPSSPGAVLAREQVDVATLVVLDSGAKRASEAASEPAPGRQPAAADRSRGERERLVAVLADGPLGSRPLLDARDGMPGWGEVLAALHHRASRTRRVWPGEVVFDRVRLRHALAALRAREAGVPMRGLFRTAREWYRWDPEAAEPWVPTHWRLDSQLECALTGEEIDAMLSSAIDITA
jgi:hypothetical protein